MGVTLVGTGAAGTGTGAISVPYPTGLENNDILILQLCNADDGGEDTGGGFTLIGESRSGGGGSTDVRCYFFYSVSDGTETGNLSVADSGSATSGRMTAWRGCDPLGPIEADFGEHSVGSLNTSVQYPAITTTKDHVMVLLGHCAGDNNSTTTPSSGDLETMTELYDSVFTTHDDYEMQLCYGIALEAGTKGTWSATQTGSEQEANLTIGLIPLPSNPAVLSVESFTVSMPDATASTDTLSMGQVIGNCVPYMTIMSDDESNEAQMVDVVANAGTNQFDFTAAAAGARTLEVTVVEYDPDEVAVQEVSFTVAGGLQATVGITEVDRAKTFPVVYASSAGDATDDFRNIMMHVNFSSATNIQITKVTHAANLLGHAYIVEAINEAWLIHTGGSIAINYTAAETLKNETIACTPAQTGLWGYWTTSEDSDDPRDAIWDGVITDATNMDLTRANSGTPSATGSIRAFAVKFADTVAVVQQGEFNYATATTDTAAINAPTVLANAMVVATNHLGWCEGSGTTDAKAACQGRMSFNSSIEVLGTRAATGEGNYRQNFQVIEWLRSALPNPAVLSVEKFSISMPDATVSTPALSLGQDIDNCVPFLTIQTDNETNRAQIVDVAKNGGTDKFDFTAHADGSRNLEVTIVEFDPAEVTVQEVAWSMSGSATDNVTVTAVVEANTFPVIYGKVGTNYDDYAKILYRATFTSTTNLLITKDTTDDISGHVYILEALNGAWSIETGASIPTSYASADKTKNVAISVEADYTAVWSYWDTSENDDDTRDAVWDTTITDGENLDFERGLTGTPAATGDIETFVVQFARSVAEVQHGKFVYGSSATKTAAINAVTLDNSMVVATNNYGWCESAGFSGDPKSQSLGRMEFNSNVEILATRRWWDGINFEQNYQVIEWLIAAVGGGDDEPIIIMIG